MNLGLASKTYFVTGAASGIGVAATSILRAAGANVGACDRDRDGLTTRHASGDGNSAIALLPADVGEQHDVQDAVRACRERFGRIDGVLHFAAILDSHQIEELTPEIWDKVMAVNLRGTYLVVQAVIPCMREQGGGRIVLTASDSARMGSLVSGPAYAASKGGVIALTHTLALYLGPSRITVNAVCPGLTMTGMSKGWSQDLIRTVSKRTPLGRLAEPEDIARVAIFLASDAADFITGEVVEVNGGIHFD